MKDCPKCGICKSHLEFDQDPSKWDGLSGTCSGCRRPKAPTHLGRSAWTEKRCSRCKLVKPKGEFSRSSTGEGFLSEDCKACKRAITKERHYERAGRKYDYSAKGMLKRAKSQQNSSLLYQNLGCSPWEFFSSYSWTCWLCLGRMPTLQEARAAPRALRPTLDHVIPLQKGGKNEVSNCRPAHFGCNARKGSKMVEELILPFPMRTWQV